MEQNENEIENYQQLVYRATPTVNFLKTGLWSFLCGGGICCIGEILRLWLTSLKLSETDIGIYISSFFIVLTAILTATGLFHKIAKFGGAGTFVPITGFANSVVAPALEFKTEGYVLGMCSKMFIIAGPVIVFGVVSAMIYGVIEQFLMSFGVI